MESAEIRRANARRLLQMLFDDNRSELARRLEVRASYVNDLLKDGSEKPFGEKMAARIEKAAGLLPGQLSIPNSPLHMDESRRDTLSSRLQMLMDGLSDSEKSIAFEFIEQLVQKRPKRRRSA